MDQAPFYDTIAESYHLIYADWEGSMRRHGEAIAAMLGDRLPRETRVLDVSAGIGTQSLPLAALGYDVVARDLSEGAINRLRREAAQRGLEIDATCCDMRQVRESVSGAFDAVVSFDNSVPHLGSDEEISRALTEIVSCLRGDGVVLVSLRDYSSVDRSPRSVHRYGEHLREGIRLRLSQEWEWTDDAHYWTTMVVEEDRGGGWKEALRTKASYYAISLERLEWLMQEAGLVVDRVGEPVFFQPVLRGRAG